MNGERIINLKKIKINIEKNKSEEEKIEKIEEKREEEKEVEQLTAKENFEFLEKIAKTCLYLLIILTPLFFLPLTRAPVEINKQVLAAFLVFIAFICYLIRSLNTRQIIYPKSLLALAVLILWLAVGISTILSRAPWFSVFGNFFQPDTFLAFSIYVLAFFLTAVLFKPFDAAQGKKDLTKIGLCFLAGLIFLLVFGLLQIFGKFINFNPLGSVFSWGVFIAFGLVMIVAVLINLKLPRNFSIILSVVALLILATLIVLNFPLLWVGLALAMFLLTTIKFAARQPMTLPLVLVIISLFFLLISPYLFSLVAVPAEIRPNFSTTLSVIKGVLTGNPEEKPSVFYGASQFFFGSGPATFSFDYARFRPQALNQTAFWSIRFNQGFNLLFSILATLGIIGILAFFFLIFSFVRQSWQAPTSPWRDPSGLTIVAGVSFLIIFLFIYPASFTQLLFVFLGLGLLAAEPRASVEINFYEGNKGQRIRGLAVFLITILLLSFVLLAFYLTGQKYVAAIYYEKGFTSLSLDQSLNNFDKAAKLDPQSDQYLRAFSQTLISKGGAINQEASAAISPQDLQNLRTQLQNVIALAVNNAQQAVTLNPLDALNWSNLANIYENLIPLQNANIFAEENYRKVMELEPTNPQAPVDLARILVIQEKLDQAKTALEQSIQLKSDYAPAHFLLAQIYVREGDLNKAIEKVASLAVANPRDAGLAFQLGLLYYHSDQTGQAQNEFERAVALDENYSNARYFLGLIYDRKGYQQAAIEQFEKIEVFNPDNQEVKKILANLRADRPALENIVPPAPPPTERPETPVPASTKNQNQ